MLNRGAVATQQDVGNITGQFAQVEHTIASLKEFQHLSLPLVTFDATDIAAADPKRVAIRIGVQQVVKEQLCGALRLELGV